MAQKNNPQYEARLLLDKFGLDDIIDIPMSDFVSGIDLIYMEEPLNNCDGKIIFGDKKTGNYLSLIHISEPTRPY